MFQMDIYTFDDDYSMPGKVTTIDSGFILRQELIFYLE